MIFFESRASYDKTDLMKKNVTKGKKMSFINYFNPFSSLEDEEVSSFCAAPCLFCMPECWAKET